MSTVGSYLQTQADPKNSLSTKGKHKKGEKNSIIDAQRAKNNES